MAQRHQRGWLKKEMRAEGETWVLFFRTTPKSDGKRVENKVRIGLAKDLPNKASVDKLPLDGARPTKKTTAHRFVWTNGAYTDTK